MNDKFHEIFQDMDNVLFERCKKNMYLGVTVIIN